MHPRIIKRRDHPQTIHLKAAPWPPVSLSLSYFPRPPCAARPPTTGEKTAAAVPAAGKGTSLFNGKDLSGWEGAPGWWTVEDGALTAQSTPEKPCTECNYLVWKGGKPADFELTCDFKLSASANSGVQIRSETRPNWDTYGYQADMTGDGGLVGFVYHHKRGLIAARGEKVTITADGKKEVQKIGDAAELLKSLQAGGMEHLSDHLPRAGHHASCQRRADVPDHRP